MSSRAKVLIAVAVLVLVVVGGGLWWFLRDDAPDAVSLDAALDQVDDGTSDTTATGTSATASAIEGTWTIDARTGGFDFESATGTFAGFRVDEELAGIGAATAVGRTGDITGDFSIEGTTVSEATFEVDLTTITTNESRRDSRVQDALETSSFPTATFALIEPLDLGAGAADGESVSVTAVGDLSIHGEAQSVDFPLEAQLVDDTVVLVGSLDLSFSDYGVVAPTSPIALSVDDHGVLELQFLLIAT